MSEAIEVTDQEIKRVMSELGRRGTGKSKARSKQHYQALAAVTNKIRSAKRAIKRANELHLRILEKQQSAKARRKE
jgi:hypothetical protein